MTDAHNDGEGAFRSRALRLLNVWALPFLRGRLLILIPFTFAFITLTAGFFVMQCFLAGVNVSGGLDAADTTALMGAKAPPGPRLPGRHLMGPSVTLETSIDLVAWHRAVGLGLVSILSFGVISFGVGAVIALAIRTALKSLSEGVEQITQGKLPADAKGARVNEINELHARFQRMAQTMNALIQETGMGATIAVDMAGRVRMLNSLAQLLLSAEPAEVMGKPIREVLNGQAGGANSVFSSQVEASLDKQEPLAETPVDLALKGGRRAHVMARTSFFSSDGEQRMAIVLSDRKLVDTTGMRKQIEQAARFLTLGSFATTLAHEIRNPLGSLAGLAELLAEEDPDPALKKEFIEHIQQGTDRLNRLIEGLYDIASLGNSEQTPHAIKDIVLDGVGERRHMAKAREVELIVNVEEGLPLINGNREWLARAVRNLVDNAIDATPPGGVVTVCARAAAGGDPGGAQRREVEFSVHNTGSFIDEKMRKKIFEPFFTSKRTGMGLGLSIVQEITQSHGGRLWVESDREKGTRFVFRIPSLD